MDPDIPGGMVSTKPFYDVVLRLSYDFDAGKQQDEQEQKEDAEEDD